MQELPDGLDPGALVHAREECWYVRQLRRWPRCAVLTLEGLGPTNLRRTTTLLLPFDRIDPIADLAPRRRRRQAVIRGVLHFIAGMRPARRLWSAAAARMELFPWQLEPALSVLEGATRVLLADAVGLGKTVQAGLILAELRTRGLVDRALVLAPAAVRSSWAEELRGRFDLPVAIVDPTTLLDLEHAGPVGANPWSRAPILVSSIDLVKRPEILTAVERAPVDLLIVDEAHHATPGTDRHAAIARLAEQVPWLVLASATPHSGDAAAYRSLIAIGEVGTPPADRMRIFRRSHGDVRLLVARRTHVLRVRPSAAERHLQAGVLAYARALCRGPAGATPGVQLLASVLARRATSSPWAARVTLQRRLDLVAAAPLPRADGSPLLPWEECESEPIEDTWVAAPGLEDRDAERACLRDLVSRADAAVPAASKLARLRRLLERLREPVIVFSEFRDTLEACRLAVEPAVPVTSLHGELDVAERQRRLTAFLEGRARVLLSTDVAGEGLNLQGPSRLVVTVEWPWSPLRLEQRIGRVHRLGQSRLVHAIHLTARDSYEETVVARVLSRAARAADALSADTASTVASEILGEPSAAGANVPPAEGAWPGGALKAQAVHEAARVNALRELAGHGRRVGPTPLWGSPRRGTSRHVVVMVEVTRHVASGWLRGTRVVPIAVTLHRVPADRREWRTVCRRLAADRRVRLAAIEASADPEDHTQWAQVRARLTALVQRRRQQRPRTLQPSLFDKRALREMENRDAVHAQWDDWQARTVMRLGDGDVRATARVVAILPLGATAR